MPSLTPRRTRHVCPWSACLASALLLLLGVFRADAIIDPALQMQLGNPSGATADTNNHNNYLIQRPIETLDYNDNRGQANWASWNLTSGDANSAVNRQDSFATDTNLPAGFYQVTNTAYVGSGYDRGHLCPSADRTDTTNNNDMTFLMSNMMPQAPNNNQGVWATFETYCRTLASAGNEVLIQCGPGGFGTNRLSSNSHVLIASNTWKIVVIVPLGAGTALSRITTLTNRVISIRIPNTNGVSSAWTNYVTSARQIEAETGLNFFTALPGTIASAFRAKIDTLVNPAPPAIVNFTPTIGLPNSTVVITGTNFNGASVVSFNGTNTTFIVDSTTQITAIVPPNANTGLIAVTTPGGTAASLNSFIVGGAVVVDLAVSSSHTGSFTQGGSGYVYTLTVTNVGTLASSGPVTVVNTLPTGLSATAINGSGWTVDLPTLTSTRSDSLAVGAGYPPITITVSAATNAPALVTNSVVVSGGNDPVNGTASDPTIILSAGGGAYTGVLAGWDTSTLPGGSGNFGPSPLTPSTNAPNLTVVGLTRGSGVTQSGTGAAKGWGGTGFTNSAAATAVASNQFATFSATANAGYKVSFASVSRFDYRRSNTGPSAGVLQYQLGSGAFVDITNLSYSISNSTPASIGAIDLSGFPALQNVSTGTNVTFRIVNYGGTSSAGTWYVFDTASSTAPDLALQGTVTPITTITNPPALPPTFTLLSLTNNQFQFTVAGTAGSNYVLQAAANLSAPVWIALTTNAAPFVFVESNAALFGQRFYRALVKP